MPPDSGQVHQKPYNRRVTIQLDEGSGYLQAFYRAIRWKQWPDGQGMRMVQHMRNLQTPLVTQLFANS